MFRKRVTVQSSLVSCCNLVRFHYLLGVLVRFFQVRDVICELCFVSDSCMMGFLEFDCDFRLRIGDLGIAYLSFITYLPSLVNYAGFGV